MSSASVSSMGAWKNGERISLSYFADNSGFKKTLLKMLVMESNGGANAKQQQQDQQQSPQKPQQPQLDIKKNVGDDDRLGI